MYEANYEAWTLNKTYPYNYFFNDHPNAGLRSFDYHASMMGMINTAIYMCCFIFTVPMALRKLLCGSSGVAAVDDMIEDPVRTYIAWVIRDMRDDGDDPPMHKVNYPA